MEEAWSFRSFGKFVFDMGSGQGGATDFMMPDRPGRFNRYRSRRFRLSEKMSMFDLRRSTFPEYDA
jgi:hypothetical protein